MLCWCEVLCVCAGVAVGFVGEGLRTALMRAPVVFEVKYWLLLHVGKLGGVVGNRWLWIVSYPDWFCLGWERRRGWDWLV